MFSSSTIRVSFDSAAGGHISGFRPTVRYTQLRILDRSQQTASSNGSRTENHRLGQVLQL
ncbi:hypothetical protein PILCRDRAFT_739462 [Piloderma croceum F 1598]|uniref:Uncharacterized protein n=1 Tax=Piloderma croceum (strain F 1598) TaxID=765440 RepID=A0A0C3B5S3_PILCF|nr:hypothetical protein PILCRDRAFT_739462 [Piloderma croceum F 1598]